MSKKAFYRSFFQGIGGMILILALAIGRMTNQLGTDTYLASLGKDILSPALVPVITFLLSAMIAFSTGTSWGTFSIMMPVALGVGASIDAQIPLVIGAVVASGIFGDHASPISDTTVISSLAAGYNHIEHVTSQLPCAWLAGFISTLLFTFSGLLNQP